jgi:hypothetical protein
MVDNLMRTAGFPAGNWGLADRLALPGDASIHGTL